MFASTTWRTYTTKVADTVDTGAAVTARIRRALVHVYPTIGSGKTVRTLTQEPIDTVDTFAAVITRLRHAIVYVVLTVIPLETVPAYALIIVARIHASATV